jgi:capsular exopolysaccharide synthesis family protein
MTAPIKLENIETAVVRAHYENAAYDTLRSLWNHKLLIALALSGALLLALLMLVLMGPRYAGLLVPKYTGEALIQFNFSREVVDTGAKIQPVASVEAVALVDSAARMIRSRATASAVVARLGLSKDPELGRQSAVWTTVSTVPSALGLDWMRLAAIRQALGLEWVTLSVVRSALGLGSASPSPHDLAVKELMRRVTVTNDPRSYLISVAATAETPERAAKLANAVALEYLRGQLLQKLTDAQVTVEHEMAAISSVFGSNHPNYGRGRARLDELQARLRTLRDGSSDDDAIKLAAGPWLLAAEKVVVPSSPSMKLILGVPVGLALVAGIWLAVMLDRRGLRSERDVNSGLGLPCIGFVPQLPRTGRTRPHRFMLMEPFGGYTEAIRSTATALGLASPHRAPKIVLISSSVAKEGKTTLAVSMAVYAALVLRRVLLIDLDFRHPSILLAEAEKGVPDVLLNNTRLEDVIRHIPELGLDCLPMSRCGVDPLALLAGERMRTMLGELRETYDCILIDSPPLLGIAETQLLASMADKVILVVKWGSTRRELVQKALELLSTAASFNTKKETHEIPSVVLTQVCLKQPYSGYGSKKNHREA